MNLPAHENQLSAWECHHCRLGFRTRTDELTISYARMHLWFEHRSSAPVLPFPAMWDARMQGDDVLITTRAAFLE